MSTWTLIATKGCGSVLVEAAFVLTGIAYEREEIDYASDGPDKQRLLALNPLGQVPTLVAPDGGVMTESAAMVLHLDEVAPAAGLLPPAGTRERRDALRWLIHFVATIYPTFTFGDTPEKFVGDAGPRLRDSANARREAAWRQVEAVAAANGGPWFLGATRSMLDVYICTMSYWRPRRPWFAEHCPSLYAIALAIAADPALAPLFKAEFVDACDHDVILNAQCIYCGTTDIDPVAVSPKKPATLIAPDSLARKKL